MVEVNAEERKDAEFAKKSILSYCLFQLPDKLNINLFSK